MDDFLFLLGDKIKKGELNSLTVSKAWIRLFQSFVHHHSAGHDKTALRSELLRTSVTNEPEPTGYRWMTKPLHVALGIPVGSEILAALYHLHPTDALFNRWVDGEPKIVRPSELLYELHKTTFPELLRRFGFSSTDRTGDSVQLEKSSDGSLSQLAFPGRTADTRGSLSQREREEGLQGVAQQSPLALAVALARVSAEGSSHEEFSEEAARQIGHLLTHSNGEISPSLLAFISSTWRFLPTEIQQSLLSRLTRDETNVYLLKMVGIEITQSITADETPFIFKTLRNIASGQAENLIAYLLIHEPQLFVPNDGGQVFSDKNGDTIFHVLSELHPEVLISLAEQDFVIPEAVNVAGLTPLAVRLLNSKAPFEFVTFAEKTKFKFLNHTRVGEYSIGNDNSIYQADQVIRVLLPHISRMSREQFQDFSAYFSRTKSIYQSIVFVEALGVTSFPDAGALARQSISLYQVVANVIQDPAPKLNSLLRSAPRAIGKTASPTDYLNDAELYLLLNRPSGRSVKEHSDLVETVAEKFGFLRRMSSENISRFQYLLGRIGTLSHSYEKWRIEALSLGAPGQSGTRHTGASLFEYFAFGSDEAAYANRNDSRWGGLQIFVPPEKMKVILSDAPELNASEVALGIDRRGLLVSSSDGILFIRNSSPAFGRHRAHHCAYVSLEPLSSYRVTERDLREFPVSLFENLTPLSSKIQTWFQGADVSLSDSRNVRRIWHFFEKFREFKCNTKISSAWDNFSDTTSGKDQLVGLHLSPGFSRWVEHVAQAFYTHERKGASVQLGAYHPDFPAWHPYRFLNNAGKETALITIGREELAALRDLADLNGNAGELERLGLYHFFQHGLLANCAELVATIND